MNKHLIIAAILSALMATAAWGGTITGSKHDLSRNSAGAYKVDFIGTAMICVFCHTPHTPVPAPLWNRLSRTIPPNAYRLYSTSTSMYNVSNSNGFSADSISSLCLDCHDGSQLGGNILRVQPIDGNSNVTGPNGETGIAADRPTRFGANLRGHHPVNFNITKSGEAYRLGDIIIINGYTYMKTKNASTGLPLFKNSRGDFVVECSTCHSAHDPAAAPFLRLPLEGSALCLACHLY